VNMRHDLLDTTLEQPREQSLSRLRGISLPLVRHTHDPCHVGDEAPIIGGHRGLDRAQRPGIFQAENDPVEPSFCSIGRYPPRRSLIPLSKLLEADGFAAREVVETDIVKNGHKLICVMRLKRNEFEARGLEQPVPTLMALPSLLEVFSRERFRLLSHED